MRNRLIYGTLLVALVVGLFWLDERVGGATIAGITLPRGVILVVLVAAMLPLGAVELRNLGRAKSIDASAAVITFGAAVTIIALVFARSGPSASICLAASLVVSLTVALLWACRNAQPQGAIASVGLTLLGVVYFGILGAFYLLMRQEWSAWVVLAAILVVKCGDTGAYFTGTAIGRRKLIPWLSPKKTWEGLFGAIALAAAAAALAAFLLRRADLLDLAPHIAAIGGALLALIGHAGDLTISLLKRDAAVKDSGNLIPGSGGILDLLDSPLFAAPFIYALLHAAT